MYIRKFFKIDFLTYFEICKAVRKLDFKVHNRILHLKILLTDGLRFKREFKLYLGDLQCLPHARQPVQFHPLVHSDCESGVYSLVKLIKKKMPTQ